MPLIPDPSEPSQWLHPPSEILHQPVRLSHSARAPRPMWRRRLSWNKRSETETLNVSRGIWQHRSSSQQYTEGRLTDICKEFLSHSYWEEPLFLSVPLQPYILEICDSLRGKIFQKFIERWDGGGVSAVSASLTVKPTASHLLFFSPSATNSLDSANGRTWSSTSMWVRAVRVTSRSFFRSVRSINPETTGRGNRRHKEICWFLTQYLWFFIQPQFQRQDSCCSNW